jgi:hypothetical protein
MTRFPEMGRSALGSATPAALVMNANKTVAAFFSAARSRGEFSPQDRFDQGSEEWSFGSYEGASAEGSVESGSYNVVLQLRGTKLKIQLTQRITY